MKLSVSLTLDQIYEALTDYVQKNLPALSEHEVTEVTFYANTDLSAPSTVKSVYAELEQKG